MAKLLSQTISLIFMCLVLPSLFCCLLCCVCCDQYSCHSLSCRSIKCKQCTLPSSYLLHSIYIACHGQSHPAWPRDKEDGIHGIQDPKLSLDERKCRNPPKQTNRFVIPPISARIPRYVIDHLYVNCMINIYVNISSLNKNYIRKMQILQRIHCV